MSARRPAVVCLLVVCVLTSLWVGVGNAVSQSEGNGLSANEAATLWSRDDDTVSASEFETSSTGVQAVARGTDFSFKRPPATAATWTRNDFQDLDAGEVDESVYPAGASVQDGTYVADAHVSVFAVQPSTRTHLAAGETPLYIAPSGSVRGFVDYRVRPSVGNQSVEIVEHEISSVRLLRDGEVIQRQSGTHTPTLSYDSLEDGPASLTLEADIRVRVDAGREGETVETLTVSDSLSVVVYDLRAYGSSVEYPDGDRGVSVFQTQPWQGYVLSSTGEGRVRGVWRFYTARETAWDRLVRSKASGQRSVSSPAVPVYVHAYPSRIGPRAEPVGEGPQITRVWGIKRGGVETTIGENVSVEVVDEAYTTSYGVAVRSDSVSREDIRVVGIVRGVNTSVSESAGGSTTKVKESNLSAEVVEQDASSATIRVELRDADTGQPIVLKEPKAGSHPIGFDERNGYVTVAGQRVETNSTGVAVVTVSDPDVCTVRYHPDSWLDSSPAYVSDTATVRWHPLSTLDGWWNLVVTVGWNVVPFAIVYVAGRQLYRLFDVREFV